jgi:hypothetical protein
MQHRTLNVARNASAPLALQDTFEICAAVLHAALLDASEILSVAIASKSVFQN